MKRFRGLGPWALCLLACAAEPGPSPTDAGFAADAALARTDAAVDAGLSPDVGPSDREPEAWIEPLAAAECAFEARCRELDFMVREGADAVACRLRSAEGWRRRLAARQASAELTAQAETCQAALLRGLCWKEPRSVGQACWAIQSGGRSLGAACALSSDCATGFCDSPAPGLACGRCAAWRGIDQACELEPEFACGPDAICEQGQCSPLPAVGFGCAGRCQGLLDCPRNGEGFICVPPIGLGDGCEASFGGGPYCPEERALACVAHRCERVLVVSRGEACDAQRWCRAPEEVCGATGRCELRPLVALGEACLQDVDCGPLAYCGAERCAARGVASSPCTRNAECAAPTLCLGAPRTCTATVVLDCL